MHVHTLSSRAGWGGTQLGTGTATHHDEQAQHRSRIWYSWVARQAPQQKLFLQQEQTPPSVTLYNGLKSKTEACTSPGTRGKGGVGAPRNNETCWRWQ